MTHTNSRLPKDVGDLTVEWFNEVVAPRVGTERALGLGFEDGSGGRGFSTQVVRLSVQWASPLRSLPESFIVKLAIPQIAVNSAGYLEALNVERRWYESEAATSPIRVPRCYYAESDDSTRTFCLALEDLGWMTAVDPVDGLTADQAKLAVSALAEVHAYEPRSSDWTHAPQNPPAALLSRIEQSWDTFLEFCAAAIPEGFYDLRGFLRAVEYGATAIRTAPRSFVHGDYKLDNLLFGETDADVKVAVLDWQGAGYAWAIEELAGFLPRSLKSRVAVEPLLSDYYSHAASNSQDKLITKDEFLDLYRQALVLSLAANVAEAQTLLTGEWSGGDEARQQRIVDYMRLIFTRKLGAMAAD